MNHPGERIRLRTLSPQFDVTGRLAALETFFSASDLESETLLFPGNLANPHVAEFDGISMVL